VKTGAVIYYYPNLPKSIFLIIIDPFISDIGIDFGFDTTEGDIEMNLLSKR